MERTQVSVLQQKHLFWARLRYKSVVIPWGRDGAKIRRKICQTARNELETVAVSPKLGRNSCLKDLGSRACAQLNIMMSPGQKEREESIRSPVTSHLPSHLTAPCFKEAPPAPLCTAPGMLGTAMLLPRHCHSHPAAPRCVCELIGRTAEFLQVCFKNHILLAGSLQTARGAKSHE